jgi:peptidoglycan/LPS O-acetylase OafA/YrhL
MACHYYPFSRLLFGLPAFGWAGVELFFVLSGFLITSILLNMKSGPHPYKIFYLRRILRIFPPYFAVLLFVILVAKLEHDSIAWPRVGQDVLFLQSFHNTSHVLKQIAHILTGTEPIPNPFVRQPLPPAEAGFPISGFSTSYSHTWSLSVEEWFYILWAPMVLKLRRRALLYCCMAVCGAALFIRWFGFLGVSTYFVFFSRIDVLMGGALLALWVERRRSLQPAERSRIDMLIISAAAVCCVLLLAIVVLIAPVLGREIRASPAFSVFGLPLLGFSFAGVLSYVISNAGSDRLSCRLLRLKPVVTLGVVSYTLYLIHVPVYFLVTQAAARLRIGTGDYYAALVISTISAALSIGLAWLSFKYFELPILSYKDRLTERIISLGNSSSPRDLSE